MKKNLGEQWFDAVKRNAIDTVRQLFFYDGINIDLQDYDGNTALIWAAYYGHKQIVQFLLENGANPNLQDSDGSTALIYAIIEDHGYTEIVRLLLENGANPDLQDCEGSTALMGAASWGREDIVRLLLEKGANPALKDEEGDTALYFADDEEIAQLIEKYLDEQENRERKQKEKQKVENIFNKLMTIAKDKKLEKEVSEVINQYKEDETRKDNSNEDEVNPNN